VNLPGRLSRTTLGDLFGTLYRARATGVLELVETRGATAGTSHRVYFSAGLVDRIDTANAEPRLGELLLRDGTLDREALRRLLACLVENPGRRTGELVTAELMASDAVVAAALKAQLRTRLDTVFALTDAEVRFHVRRPPPRTGPSALLVPREFLHGRRRARGESGTRPDADPAADYELFGLERGASRDSVRQAFRRLASEHHPDRHPGASSEELATLVRRFSRISAAYHRLG